MSAWTLAVLGLLPPVAMAVLLACRGALASRLVAVQLASTLTSGVLVLMTFAFDQSAFTDLPLALALLGLTGTLLMAVFVERWL